MSTTPQGTDALSRLGRSMAARGYVVCASTIRCEPGVILTPRSVHEPMARLQPIRITCETDLADYQEHMRLMGVPVAKPPKGVRYYYYRAEAD